MKRKAVLVEISQVESAFPLASAYLRNYGGRHAASAGEWEFAIRPFNAAASADHIVDRVRADEADLYTFSCYNWNMKRIRGVVQALRRARPDAVFLLGGPQVLTCAARYLERDQENVFVCNGEGENTFRAFLDARASERPDFSTVPGLSFHRDGTLHTTAPAPQVDLNAIPSPFLESPFDDSTYFVHYLWESNRGCPFKCTFCLWGQLQDDVSQFSTERLKEEITWLARRQYMLLHICDANWGMLARDLELAEHIARCKRDFGVPFIVNAAHIKNQPARVLAMSRAFAEVGIRSNAANALQSMNDSTLVAIKRKNSSDELLAGFQRSLHELELGSIAEIIWPLPEETVASFTRGFAKMARMRIASVFCYPLMLLNNTEMSARRDEHGFRTVWDESDVKEIEWVIATRDVSEAECQDGFWFYLAWMVLYNARGLYYTLHFLNDAHGVGYETVLWRMAERLRRGDGPLARMCRRVLDERNPSLDGAVYGTLFGWGLHEHREEVDGLVRALVEPWRELPGVRELVELDLMARPFPFRGKSERRHVVELSETAWRGLAPNVEVGGLDRPGRAVLIDHARDQLPHVTRTADDEGYLFAALLANVRSFCPRMTPVTRDRGPRSPR